MKLPPRSTNASNTRRLSSLEAPKPQSSPKVMVPRQSSETRSPLFPRSLYRMALAYRGGALATISGVGGCFGVDMGARWQLSLAALPDARADPSGPPPRRSRLRADPLGG